MMSDGLLRFGLTTLVTLIVVVDPVGVAPIFAALTKDASPARRQSIVTRAVAIAFGVALFFLLAGRGMLSYLGVTVEAFAISGGILLFATALPMLFGHRPGLQAPEHGERDAVGQDISIFPLAIPLLSGPGTIATILLLTSQAGADRWRLGVLILAMAMVFLVTYLVLQASARLLAYLGESGIHIITRVMGIILAALAVQFVMNGIAGYYRSLIAP